MSQAQPKNKLIICIAGLVSVAGRNTKSFL